MTGSEAGNPPERSPQEYFRFDTEAVFQATVDRLFQQEGRELRVFDSSLSVLKLNSPARIEMLRAFLARARTQRVYMVVHQTDHVTRHCPRLMNLLARYNHAMEIHRTAEDIRELQDSFLVLDRHHYVRRPVGRFFRGGAGFNDEADALTMRARFQEIWNSSYPGVSSTTPGL